MDITIQLSETATGYLVTGAVIIAVIIAIILINMRE